jgi:hypothetical protein
VFLCWSHWFTYLPQSTSAKSTNDEIKQKILVGSSWEVSSNTHSPSPPASGSGYEVIWWVVFAALVHYLFTSNGLFTEPPPVCSCSSFSAESILVGVACFSVTVGSSNLASWAETVQTTTSVRCSSVIILLPSLYHRISRLIKLPDHSTLNTKGVTATQVKYGRSWINRRQ